MTPSNTIRRRIILATGVASAVLYAVLGAAGDLRGRPAVLIVSFAVLSGLMLAAWRAACGGGGADGRLLLGAALVFRLLAAWGDPALSDDLYRFVWDGRVQLAGHHPYAHAPLDAELADLRDEDVWPRINHPELPTIYPPLAQVFFLAMAALGAGPAGFKLAFGLLDFAVVLALWRLLGRLGVPRDRVLLYAWNPLAVLETAGSGHVEPLGLALLLMALAALTDAGRGTTAAASLAAAVHVKLLPAVLVPGFLRRLRIRDVVVLGAVLAGLALPYALTGPAVGGGLFAYAERWEHNASLYSMVRQAIEWLDPTPLLKGWIGWAQERFAGAPRVWDFLYRHAWPRELARLTVGLGALGWILALAFGRRRRQATDEALLALGGVLLLSPTVHPWYLLWLLPLAASRLHWGWLGVAAVMPLSYLATGEDVPLAIRLVEYAPLVGWLCWRLATRRRPLC